MSDGLNIHMPTSNYPERSTMDLFAEAVGSDVAIRALHYPTKRETVVYGLLMDATYDDDLNVYIVCLERPSGQEARYQLSGTGLKIDQR